MGVQRKHVNELCNNCLTVTAATALILARVFGNSPDFWLNVQRQRSVGSDEPVPVNANGSNARSHHHREGNRWLTRNLGAWQQWPEYPIINP